MDCKKAEEVIFTDYIDGRILDEVLLNEVEVHLASCSHCRDLERELKSLRAGFKGMPRMEPPREVWNRIRSKIEKPQAHMAFPGIILRSIPRLSFRIRPAFVAAAATVAILALLLLSRMAPYSDNLSTALTQEDLVSMVNLGDNGNGSAYNFNTPEENYFL